MTPSRTFTALLLACAVAVPLAACGDDSADSSYAYGGGGGSSSGGTYGDCSQYTSCGTCTPVDGCGWCFNATSGVCTTDPDNCLGADVSEFTWTWEPTGCPGVDASVVPIEAGTTTPEAGVAEAGPEGASLNPDGATVVDGSGDDGR
jgi:hypothetical protein